MVTLIEKTTTVFLIF